jgi:hypothetical protein
MFQENALTLSAATAGGAAVAAAMRYSSLGYAKDYKSILVHAALGGAAGLAISTGIIKSKEYAQASGEANWALIGGASGFGASMLYGLVYKNYIKRQSTTATALIKQSVMWMTAAGALGTALTYVQKKY